MATLRKICLFLTCIAVQHFESAFGAGWDYGKHGPTTGDWGKLSAVCDNGKKQSPINLDKSSAKVQGSDALSFKDYDKKMKAIGTNNGHTVVFSQDPDSSKKIQPTMSKGGLGTTYTFHSLHFHWGSKDSVGSEHFLNGKQLSMELHLVHYNSSFKNLGDAIASKNPTALAVLGVFFNVSDGKSSSPTMDTFTKALADIMQPKKSTKLKTDIKLMDLLPKKKDFIFRYMGSLTTPNCDQVVAWTVFEEPQTITMDQMSKFRSLKDPEGENLVDNFRPLQKLGDRQLQAYGKKSR